MKILATAIALATVLASPLYAAPLHPRHMATFVNHAHGHTAVFRNRAASRNASWNLLPALQDPYIGEWFEGYPRDDYDGLRTQSPQQDFQSSSFSI
jgi:hypothetical protein